jgi:preprotein translocase subunit SecG
MTLFLIIMLSVVMVLDCIVLVFLVLMQLPKKEAGAGGLAFGGAASDALFGAGSGNFLTKTTKWAAGIFFALALILSLLQSYRAHQKGSDFLRRVKENPNSQPAIGVPPANPPAPTTPPAITQPAAGAVSGSNVLLTTPQIDGTAPAVAPSNTAPAATPK